MALAAFRSTTKRTCAIGSQQESGVFTPSQRTLGQRHMHRRSRSFSDFSSQYFSDSGSVAGDSFRLVDSSVRKAGSSSRCLTSDSESEVEPRFLSHNRGPSNVDFTAVQHESRNADVKPHEGLKRSSSQKDLAKYSREVYYRRGRRHGNDKVSRDHPEEEKTISAVHLQMKEPLAWELDAISLYDAMRAEMRRAVADIRNELEQSLQKDTVQAASSFSGSQSTTTGTSEEDDLKVPDARKDYSAQLEQSEKRAQDLWTELAVEERRCLDLVKFVKELVPNVAGTTPQAPSQVKCKLTGTSFQKSFSSKSLDEDAHRYFEECVSLSPLDPLSTSEGVSLGVKKEEQESGLSSADLYCSKWTYGYRDEFQSKRALLEPLITFCESEIEHSGRHSSQPSRVVVSDDGLVLPWLQWETDVEISAKVSEGQGSNKDTANKRTGSSNNHASTFWRSMSSRWDLGRDAGRHTQKLKMEPLALSSGVSGLCYPTDAELSCWKDADTGGSYGVGVTSVSNCFREENHFDVETFMIQRMFLQHRIQQGTLLLCGGKQV